MSGRSEGGGVLPFGTPKVSGERLSLGSPNDIWELTRVPPGQALKIGCFFFLFLVSPKKWRKIGEIPGYSRGERILKTYQGAGH